MTQIFVKREFVEGEFETETGKLICVPSEKYATVELCFRTKNMHVPFASIKLYGSNRLVDAKATFDDAEALGEEICKRWNSATVTE
jgi:hypothetical protein